MLIQKDVGTVEVVIFKMIVIRVIILEAMVEILEGMGNG